MNTNLDQLIALEKDTREFGFDWPDVQLIIEQAIDECREIKEALHLNESQERIQEEVGDLLHTAISLCLFLNFDVDDTLAKTNLKFSDRMSAVKALTHELGLENLEGQTFEMMLSLWKKAKILTGK
jgi:uncharacterized protein YabN with tetrapyrrole methylase and pyrophosphatase domain